MTKTTLTDGTSVPADDSHTQIIESGLRKGQQQGYVVLSAEERAKGWVRPYRDAYKHVGIRPKNPLRDLTDEESARYSALNYVKYEEYPEDRPNSAVVGRFWTQAQLNSGCGSVTTMGRSLSETYARDPGFYGGTFCASCGSHFPVKEFTWVVDGQVVGS